MTRLALGVRSNRGLGLGPWPRGSRVQHLAPRADSQRGTNASRFFAPAERASGSPRNPRDSTSPHRIRALSESERSIVREQPALTRPLGRTLLAPRRQPRRGLSHLRSTAKSLTWPATSAANAVGD